MKFSRLRPNFILLLFVVFFSSHVFAEKLITNGGIDSKLSLILTDTANCTGFTKTFSSGLVNRATIHSTLFSSGLLFYFNHGTNSGNDNFKAQMYYIEKGKSASNYTDRSNVTTLIDDHVAYSDASHQDYLGEYYVYVLLNSLAYPDQACALHTNGYIVVEDVTPVARESISITDKPSDNRIAVNEFSVGVEGNSELGIKIFSMNVQRYGESSPIAGTEQSREETGDTTESHRFYIDISSFSVGRYEAVFTTSDRDSSNGEPVSIIYEFYKEAPKPLITEVRSDKASYFIGQTAVFSVLLSSKAADVDMSITPSRKSEITDTEWYFERIFEVTGTKTITFRSKDSSGTVVDEKSITVDVIQPSPDYKISDFVTSANTLETGEDLGLQATAINIGDDDTDRVIGLVYYRSEDSTINSDDVRLGADEVSRLLNNQTQTVQHLTSAPPVAKDYYYGACINVIPADSDTSNNCTTGTLVKKVTVTKPAQPDYTITAFDTDVSTVLAEQPIKLGVTTKNIGADDTDRQSGLIYYRSLDSTIDSSDVRVGIDGVHQLATNQTENDYYTVSAPVIQNTYYFGACVSSTPDDADTGNNCTTSSQAKRVVVEGDETLPPRITSLSYTNESPIYSDQSINFVIRTTGETPGIVEIRFAGLTWKSVTNQSENGTKWQYSRSFSLEGSKLIEARLNGDNATIYQITISVSKPIANIKKVDIYKDDYRVGEVATFHVYLDFPGTIKTNKTTTIKKIKDTEWLIERVFQESGDKSLLITSYNPDGTQTDTELFQFHIYEPNAPGNRPPVYQGEYWTWSDDDQNGKSGKVEQKRAIAIKSVWYDPDGNVIHGEVEYRKQGLVNWIGAFPARWSANHTNGWVLDTKGYIEIPADAALGAYEIRMRAVDKKTDGGDDLHDPTAWVNLGTFEVIEWQNRIPQITKANVVTAVITGRNFPIYIQATDPDNDLHFVQIDWWGDGNGGPKWEPDGTGVINAHFWYENENPKTTATIRTIPWTARAYDTSGGESATIRGVVIVVPPAAVSSGHIAQTGDDVATQSLCNYSAVDGNPIDMATGADLESLSLLSVQGIVPIEFALYYNSLVNDVTDVGQSWYHQHGYTARIVEQEDDDAVIFWSRNRYNTFNYVNGEYEPVEHGCKLDRLVKNDDGTFSIYRKDRSIYHFNEYGLVQRLENPQRQGIEFEYSERGQVTKVIDPISGAYLAYSYNDAGFVSKVADPLGNQVLLEYQSNRLTKITRADGFIDEYTYNDQGQILTYSLDGVTITTNTFDDSGRVVEQDDTRSDNQLIQIDYQQSGENFVTTFTDRLGHSTRYVHDKHYQLLEKTDALNNRITYTYDQNGKPTSFTDARENTTQHTYDNNGDLTLTVYADGSTEERTYDKNRNLVKTKDQLGQYEFFTYDQNNNLTSHTDKRGNTTQYTYNLIGQVTSETSPEGHTTRYEYEDGHPVRITDPMENVTLYDFDMAGRVYAKTDPVGYITNYYLDALGRKIAEADDLFYEQHWSYDARGNLSEYRHRFADPEYYETPADVTKTRYEYDSQGNKIKTIHEHNGISTTLETLTYDGMDQLIARIDARNNTTQYVRDVLGRLKETIDPKGNKLVNDFDENGNLKQVSTPLNGGVEHFYDVRNRRTKSVDVANRKVETSYDSLGRTKTILDPENQETSSYYDPNSNIIQVESPGDLSSKQSFDRDNHLNSSADPENNTRTLKRNANGQVTEERTADEAIIKYEHDGRGLITKMVNGRGQVTTYAYDPLGQLTSKTNPDETILYRYAPNGDLLEVEKNGIVGKREYDGRSRVIKYIPDTNKSNFISYEYDDANNPTTHSFNCLGWDGCRSFVHYNYDELNQLTHVSSATDDITAYYEYDAKGRLIRTTRGNGTIETRSYNAVDQLIELKDVHTVSDTTSSTTKTITHYTFEYDELGRITSENSLLSFDIPPKSTLEDMVASYGADNRLSTKDGKTFDFDADGNILEAEGLALEYDVAGRLSKAGHYTSEYDADGNRIRQIGNTDGEDIPSEYLVDSTPSLNRVLRKIERRSPSPDTEQRYVYGNGLIGVKQNGSSPYYLHYDYRGSVVAVSNSAGEVVQRFGYLPYGKQFLVPGPFTTPGDVDGPIDPPDQGDEKSSEEISTIPVKTETIPTPFGYNGKYGVMTDPNGLLYMRARYYSPELRRFLTKDLLRGQIGDLASLNRYGYVGGDPLNYIDPTGSYSQLTGYGSTSQIQLVGDHSGSGSTYSIGLTSGSLYDGGHFDVGAYEVHGASIREDGFGPSAEFTPIKANFSENISGKIFVYEGGAHVGKKTKIGMQFSVYELEIEIETNGATIECSVGLLCVGLIKKTTGAKGGFIVCPGFDVSLNGRNDRNTGNEINSQINLYKDPVNIIYRIRSYGSF